MPRLCGEPIFGSTLLPKMIADRFRLHSGYDCRERRRVRLLYRLQAAEVFEKTSSRALAYAGDLQQFG